MLELDSKQCDVIFINSHDCIRWKLLNPATEEYIGKLATCKGRFTGDPSHDFECKTARVVGEGEEEHLEEDIVCFNLFITFMCRYVHSCFVVACIYI